MSNLYCWVACVGYRRVFCKELKIPRKNTTQKYIYTKSELLGLENTTGWLCIYFASWFLLFKMNMGLAHLARFCFDFVCFLVLHFLIWGVSFFVFCIFWNFGFVRFLFLFSRNRICIYTTKIQHKWIQKQDPYRYNHAAGEIANKREIQHTWSYLFVFFMITGVNSL